MNDLTLVIIAVTILFFILLAVKRAFKKELCAICASVSITWATLFVLSQLGLFENTVLLALLMGQSIVGLYYFIEHRVQERYLLFRLPFLLTLTVVFYLSLQSKSFFLPIVSLGVLWVVFSGLYIFRNISATKGMVARIISCCKNW